MGKSKTEASRELPFARLLAAVSACVPDAVPADLLDEVENPLLAASYLIAERCGFILDHRHDRENAVRWLVEALARAGVAGSLEGEGQHLHWIAEEGERTPVRLTHADIEDTLRILVDSVPVDIAQVFTLAPSDETDTHLFAVLTSAQFVAVQQALGDGLPALLRSVGERVKPIRYRVIDLPAPATPPAASEPRTLAFGYVCEDGVVRSSEGAQIKVRSLATVRALHPGWLADHRCVYFQGSAVHGLDPATVTVLDDHFARDARGVFFGGKPLDADPETFRLCAPTRSLSGRYACDRDAVWYFDDLGSAPKKLVANAAAFRVVGEHATDDKTVWASGIPLRGAKASSWRSLAGRFWSTDGKRVYYLQQLLPKADPATFEPVLQHWAMDRHRIYDRTRLATAEAARAKAEETFAFVGDVRIVGREPGHSERDEKITLACRCQRWLRRPEELDDTPEVGEERADAWFLRKSKLPAILEGPRLLIVGRSSLNQRYRIEPPNFAWEHLTPDRAHVLERWLSLALGSPPSSKPRPS